ncbi:hypothetical protein PVAND_008552 [Polypedilum vanderplanki]|uniref:Integrase catalytic domain-containing protein n=1 Tax=Polypedilum vanderplanki TaxID=319348 RepID=A0A9J6C9X0_POLVA|nr:hypothetical protein PVAND_008552 [Polypedilum vanderplanki]
MMKIELLIFKHLKSLYLHDYEHIDGLIGIDNLKIFNWTVIENRTKVEYCPLGIRTIIGDTLIGCETPLERFFNDNVDQCEDKELFVNTCRNDSFDFRVHTLSRCNVVDQQHYQEEINLENYEEEYNKWEELIFLQENNQFESPNDSCNYYEERANSLLKKYVKRIPNSNHFQAPILWKEEDITLPTLQSYKIALRRFLITERNGKKKNEFYTYEEEMKKLLEKGYASKLTKTEINNISPLTYYVPIFFIKPENKRLRFIWDFKSKCEGKSYNDYVLSGPNLYSKIENILIHARTNEYLIKGDIEAMFHQVHLLDKDKASMRFLFRFDNETEISVYRMNVLPFGAACSPILSLYVKNIIAEEIKLISPLAYDTLINSTYVDDTVRSLPNISTAVNLCIDLKRYLKTGGFNLLKLNSNSNEILEQLQRSFKNVSHEKLFINDKEEKILGYMFDLETDTITVCFDLNNLPRNTLKNIQKPTKRTVLQVTNGFYDPLGLFGFVTSKMKILYKRVCNTTKNWDDEISNELIPLWNKCIESYNKAKFVKIPRVCTLIDYDRIDLLGFCDAGKEMICIMVFIKSYKDEKSLTRLIESRTITVNNRRNYSIPELELEAAAQLSKMIIKLKDILNYKFDNIFLLTDSSIVIYQINREKKNKLSIYAENRIKTIRQNTNTNNWYWISSDLQTADYGTKIESNCSLTYFNEWFIPKLCKENIDDWLKCNNNKTILNINELKENKNIDNDISIDSYKSFTALLNFSKRVFIFKYKFDSQYKAKKKEIEEIKEDKTLSSRQKRYILKEKERILNEIETFVEDDENWHNVAETHWLRRAQEEDKDIKDIRDILKSGKTIKKSNAFYKLLPYLDIDGLVRLRTRVNVNRQVLHLVDYDHIRPIILPKKHAITELIILEIHKNHAHSYFKTVVNSIKNKFYIRHMKNVVKRIIKTKCHYCIRFTTRLLKPIMGDLPQERLGAFEPPFSYIVIDVFGPIMVTPSKYSKKVIKRWVLACICLCTRASHMEILKDLSTESILEALEITFTIRGTAKEIYSDLAPSFLAANKKMISITNEWNIKLMSQGIIRSHIRWNNKAAYSPWTQGAAERMIGETKKLFKNFTRLMNIDSSGLTDFVLRHVLMKIVNVINNSPISIIEENCILNCLTPAHFIMMRENTQSHPLTDFNVDDLTQCWHGTKNIIKSFWEEWLRSYFNKILHREKWCTYSEPVKVGDFVLTAEKGYTDSWRIGRIIEIDMGSLEQVRAVKIKLGKNKIIENFSKLKNKKDIIDAYRKEQFSIVSRPSMLIAKINIQERNFKFKKENLRAGGVDAIMRKNDAKK